MKIDRLAGWVMMVAAAFWFGRPLVVCAQDGMFQLLPRVADDMSLPFPAGGVQASETWGSVFPGEPRIEPGQGEHFAGPYLSVPGDPMEWSYTRPVHNTQPFPSNSPVTTGRIESRPVARPVSIAEIHPAFRMTNSTQLATFADETAQPEGDEPLDPTQQALVDSLGQLPVDHGYCGKCQHSGCVPGWLWFASMETTFLWPDRDSVYSEVTVGNNDETFQAAADGGLHLAPRFALGLDHGHWGVLGRVWYQTGSDTRADAFHPGSVAPGVVQGCGVDAYTVDVEAYKRFCCNDCWSFDLGFGFRYASLKDVGQVTVTRADAEIPTAVVYGNAISIAEVHGPGMTMFFAGDRPIHVSCCSCLKWFWRARGSMTWGGISSGAQATVMALDQVPIAQAWRLEAASARTDDELFICELRTGLRWEHALMCLPGVAFVEMAFEYQWWDADGGVAGAEAIAIANENSVRAIAVAGPDIEMSLVGFTLGAGMRW